MHSKSSPWLQIFAETAAVIFYKYHLSINLAIDNPLDINIYIYCIILKKQKTY
jgi:hypothetical protein